MHATHLIYSSLRKRHEHWLPELPSPPQTHLCAVSGGETSCLPRKTVLGKSFTNQNLLAAPDSQWVSVEVFHAWNAGYYTPPVVTTKDVEKLQQRGVSDTDINIAVALPRDDYHDQDAFVTAYQAYGGGHVDALLAVCGKKRLKVPERMSSWWCDGDRFVELSRRDVREYVLTPPQTDRWAGYATTSYKKHGSLLAPVNSQTSAVWLFEETRVDCTDRARVLAYWDRITTAQRLGFGRTILESVECPAYLIAKYGLTVWREFAEWALPRRDEALYQFLCYLLPSQEELRDADHTVGTPCENLVLFAEA